MKWKVDYVLWFHVQSTQLLNNDSKTKQIMRKSGYAAAVLQLAASQVSVGDPKHNDAITCLKSVSLYQKTFIDENQKRKIWAKKLKYFMCPITLAKRLV